MEYTLDSVTHAMECLREKLNIKEIQHIPMLGSLEDLSDKTEVLGVYGTGRIIIRDF